MLGADVAGEDQLARAVGLVRPEFDDGGANDVAGITQHETDARSDLGQFIVVDTYELPEHFLDIDLVVQRLQQFLAGALAPAVLVFDVGCRETRRVLEHDARQVLGRALGVDRPAVTAFAQQRQPADMIDMRVRQDHRVDCIDREGEGGGVAFVLVAARLDHAAVEQDVFAQGFNLVAGAGDFTSGAKECQLHAWNLQMGPVS